MHPKIEPEYVRKIENSETFTFDCNPGVACFNECCRMLELALTPYDVLRLKNNLSLSAEDFLDQFCIVDQEFPGHLPQIFLGMVDDGRGSCPFVTKAGCSVYENRPGACRTYPLGRGAFLAKDGTPQEMYVLLQEPHCCGFGESTSQTVGSWNKSQGLEIYNEMNDLVMTILHHEQVRQGKNFTKQDIDVFLLGLYKLELFQEKLRIKQIDLTPILKDGESLDTIFSSQEALLKTSIRWVRHELFSE